MGVEHILRKGNKVVDFLANFIFNFAGTVISQYNAIQEAPEQAKSIILLERNNMHSLWLKKCQNKFLKTQESMHSHQVTTSQHNSGNNYIYSGGVQEIVQFQISVVTSQEVFS